MSATFTDIELTLLKWEPIKASPDFVFSFGMSSQPDKNWQDAFMQDWGNRMRYPTSVNFDGDFLRLTIQTFLSDSILDAISESVKQANLVGKQHFAAEEEAARVKADDDAAREAEMKRLDTLFLELKAKFNNPPA